MVCAARRKTHAVNPELDALIGGWQDNPTEHERLLIIADYLDDRDDERASKVRQLARWLDLAEMLPIPHEEATDLRVVFETHARVFDPQFFAEAGVMLGDYPNHRRVLPTLCARACPVFGGGRAWDLLRAEQKHAIVVAESFWCGLASPSQWKKARLAAGHKAVECHAVFTSHRATQLTTHQRDHLDPVVTESYRLGAAVPIAASATNAAYRLAGTRLPFPNFHEYVSAEVGNHAAVSLWEAYRRSTSHLEGEGLLSAFNAVDDSTQHHNALALWWSLDLAWGLIADAQQGSEPPGTARAGSHDSDSIVGASDDERDI